jgi:hypothetical protein
MTDNFNLNNDEKTSANALDAIRRRIEYLERCEELLCALYDEIGPYQSKKLSDATWSKVRNHFHFDDSE